MPPRHVSEMVAEAKTRIRNLGPDEFEDSLDAAMIVDLREPWEREENGMIRGSVHAPRGLLEFWADPQSSMHRPEFDPEKPVLLYCGGGGRSALAADTLQEMGYRNVGHLDGGFTGWRAAGKPVARPEDE